MKENLYQIDGSNCIGFYLLLELVEMWNNLGKQFC